MEWSPCNDLLFFGMKFSPLGSEGKEENQLRIIVIVGGEAFSLPDHIEKNEQKL